MKWEEIQRLRIPLWEVAVGAVTLIGVAWAAFTWADDIEDKQVKTQDQLDQLVTIVATQTTQNTKTNEEQDKAIAEVKRNFELLEQEVILRRELEDDEE
ncbi:MAG: hypothetical protein ACR2PR_07160 [Pseudohongiellaceae bacterium]